MATIDAYTVNILILDDNPADALLVRQMLQSLSGWSLTCDMHRSDEGILPQNLKGLQALHLIFVAEGYANTQMQQMLELLKFFQPDAKIVLLSNNGGINVAPQDFIAAAHAGLHQWLQKEKLSVNALHSLLSELYPDAKIAGQKGPFVKNDAQQFLPQAIRKSASDAENSATISLHSTAKRRATDDPSIATHIIEDADTPTPSHTSHIDYDALSTGLIEFEITDEGYSYKSINQSAAISEQLDRQTLVGKLLQEQTQRYENVDLIECLDGLKDVGDQQKIQALSLSVTGVAAWKNINAHRISESNIVLEIQDISEQVALHNVQKQAANIWQEIVRSLPDLSALVDEEGAIVELISGDWQPIRSDESSLCGETFTSLLQENERPLYQDQLSKVLNTGKHQSAIFCLEISDTRLWLQCRFSLLRTEASAERRVLIVCHDISEQQEQLLALAGDLSINKEIFRRAPFAMAYKDNEGRYERANPYFLDIFQLRLADLQGKTDNECLNEHVVELFGRLEQRVAASGDIAHLDVQLSADAQQSFQAVLLPLREDSTHSISSCLVLIPNDSTGHRAADANTINDTFAKGIKKKNLDR